MKQAFFIWTILSTIPALAFRNGQSDPDHPEVVALRGGGDWCNGIFVNAKDPQFDVLVTAYHCLADLRTGGLSILRGGERAASVRAYVPPNAGTPDTVIPENDLAIVLFPAGTARGTAAIASEGAVPGEDIGLSAWEPLAREQTGKVGGFNTVERLNWIQAGNARQGYVLHEDGGGIPDALGESGAPLYRNGELIGVLRGCKDDLLAGLVQDPRTGLACTFTGLHSPAGIALLSQASAFIDGLDPRTLVRLDDTVTRRASASQQAAARRTPPTGPVQQISPLQSQSQSPSRQVRPVVPRETAIVGPSPITISVLETVSQSPRSHEIVQLPVEEKPVRKLPPLEEAPLSLFFDELIRESRPRLFRRSPPPAERTSTDEEMSAEPRLPVPAPAIPEVHEPKVKPPPEKVADDLK